MTAPHNVLHTVRSLRLDGVTKVVVRNISHRVAPDFRHHVCSMLDDAALADECRAAGVEPVFVHHRHAGTAPRTIARIVRLIRRRGIDLVHANRTLDLALAGTAARICGVPVVSTLHWMGRVEDHPEDGNPRSLGRRGEMMVPVALNRFLADRVIAVSEAVRASFAGLPGFPAERVSVIYPGQDAAPPTSTDAGRQQLRAALGIADAGPILLNVGRLQPVKGQAHLIPMMLRVRRRLPNAVLLIAGEGELRGPLTRQIDAHGLGDAIRLLGARSDVDALLAVSDALILASESEAAPLPLFEAMRGARPVVATNVGGVPEIVQAGVTGYLVPRGDPAAMADAVEELLTVPERAARMGEAGRRALLERFDIVRSVRQIEDLYRALLEQRSDGTHRDATALPHTHTPDAGRPPST